MNTGSTLSAITFLDGEKGILRYRGYPVEQLGENCDFIEVAYLLIYGELPTAAQLEDFREKLRRHTMLHEDMRLFYDGFPRDAHPMAILSSVCGALSTFYQDSLSSKDPEQVDKSILRLMAKLPTIAAYAHKKSIGQPFVYPRNDLTYCENFLRMMFAVPTEPFEADPDFVDALNLLLIVHADHEQNCSTSTVRMVGSSDANLFASISAGICALWGPLHGGANEACVAMLQQIANDGGDVKKYVEMVKDKNSGVRLMGFGHRVYKNFDPRATIIKKACDKLLAKRRHQRSDLRDRQAARRSGAQGRILHRAEALSERRFLFRRDLSRDRHSGADVHGAVRVGPAAGLDRPLARDAPQPDQEDLPAAADLHRAEEARFRADGKTRLDRGRRMSPSRGAIILCGGASTRMGRDKALLPFGPDEVLLAARRAARGRGRAGGANRVRRRAWSNRCRRCRPTCKSSATRMPACGPLAGLAAGMAAVEQSCRRRRSSAVATCRSWCRRLSRGCSSCWRTTRSPLPHDGERFHPLRGRLSDRRACRSPDRCLAAGERSLQARLWQCDTLPVPMR